MMGIIMILLDYHRHKNLHAVQSWMSLVLTDRRKSWDPPPTCWGFLIFLFSNEYFLIIIYIKYVPNRLLCWMILSVYLSVERMYYQWFISCFFFYLFFLVGVLYKPSMHATLIHFSIASPWCIPVCSQIIEYQESMFSFRRYAVSIIRSPVFPAMLFVVLITSAGALPPSYAAKPIISLSLGIDQRAGESQLWGRESAEFPTSARSTERFSVHRDKAEQHCGDDEMSRVNRQNISGAWLVFEDICLVTFPFSWQFTDAVHKV